MAEDRQNQESCAHQRFEVRTWCPDCGKEFAHQILPRQELTADELQAQQASELPDREAMSLVNANLAIPVNLAAALNVLSDGSIAGAGATQTDPIVQGTGSTLPTV